MSKNFYKNLGILLQEYRNKANLSQDDIAYRLDVNQRTISNYEKGIRKIPIDVLKKYCEIVGVSLQELADRL